MPKRDIPRLDPAHMYHDTLSTPPEFQKATFRDVILEATKFQQYLPNVLLPYSYTMEDKAFIYPVRAGMDQYSHARYWDVFVIYDDNLELVPTVGSSRGIFLHNTGFISHHKVYPAQKTTYRAEIQYIVPLSTLRVSKESMTKDKNGIHTTYAIVEDPDLAIRFGKRWNEYDGLPIDRFTNEVLIGKLRPYLT